MKRAVFAVFGIALFAAAAFATDGQVLINQSTVMAAGGFPYTISQPGSYKLSGNLTVPANANGIVITVSNVSIDLNGFSITGPSVTWLPETFGITAGHAVTGVTIRNGVIRGFSSPIFAQDQNDMWILEDLIVTWSGGGVAKIQVGKFAIVRHVTASDLQITVICPSVIADSAAVTLYGEPGAGTCAFAHNATLW